MFPVRPQEVRTTSHPLLDWDDEALHARIMEVCRERKLTIAMIRIAVVVFSFGLVAALVWYFDAGDKLDSIAAYVALFALLISSFSVGHRLVIAYVARIIRSAR